MVGNLKYIIMKICIFLCDIFHFDIAFKNKPSFDVVFCIWNKIQSLGRIVLQIFNDNWYHHLTTSIWDDIRLMIYVLHTNFIEFDSDRKCNVDWWNVWMSFLMKRISGDLTSMHYKKILQHHNLSFHVDSFNKQISLHFLFSTESHYSFELQKMEECKEMKDDHISIDWNKLRKFEHS